MCLFRTISASKPTTIYQFCLTPLKLGWWLRIACSYCFCSYPDITGRLPDSWAKWYERATKRLSLNNRSGSQDSSWTCMMPVNTTWPHASELSDAFSSQHMDPKQCAPDTHRKDDFGSIRPEANLLGHPHMPQSIISSTKQIHKSTVYENTSA